MTQQYRFGDRVLHQGYGAGVITHRQESGGYYYVLFANSIEDWVPQEDLQPAAEAPEWASVADALIQPEDDLLPVLSELIASEPDVHRRRILGAAHDTIHAYDQMTAKGWWISVETDLPEPETPVHAVLNGHVGIFVRCGDDNGGWLWARCYGTSSWDNYGEWIHDDDYQSITHWQPLPKPPCGAKHPDLSRHL